MKILTEHSIYSNEMDFNLVKLLHAYFEEKARTTLRSVKVLRTLR